MLIGYARVSTSDQNLDLQIDELTKIGCEQIFCDKISGATTDRPQLKEALNLCKDGDTLVVWKLDRLGRSLKHLVDTVSSLGERGVGFKTCRDGIDTTTSSGRLVFHIFAALAEFERALIKERTIAGLEAARLRGQKGGRPPKLTIQELKIAKKLISSGTNISEISKVLNVSRVTLWRALNKMTRLNK